MPRVLIQSCCNLILIFFRVFNAGIFLTGTCSILFGLLDRIEDGTTFIVLSFIIRYLYDRGPHYRGPHYLGMLFWVWALTHFLPSVHRAPQEKLQAFNKVKIAPKKCYNCVVFWVSYVFVLIPLGLALKVVKIAPRHQKRVSVKKLRSNL